MTRKECDARKVVGQTHYRRRSAAINETSVRSDELLGRHWQFLERGSNGGAPVDIDKRVRHTTVPWGKI